MQLWVALPDSAGHTARDFAHHVPDLLAFDGGRTRVFIGSLLGVTSPVRTFTPLLGAELTLDPGAVLTLDLDPAFEHGVLVDLGPVTLDDTDLKPAELGYVAAGAAHLRLTNHGDAPARVVLLGGEPFREPLIMWWNFVGRTHEEIAVFREEWQASGERFGRVEGYTGDTDRIPAPPMPGTRLKPRLAPPGPGDPTAWG